MPRTYLTVFFMGALSFLTSALSFAQTQSAIPGVIAAGAKAEQVKDGLVFTEGPVEGPDGNLYFSDVMASKVYRLDIKAGANGQLSTVRDMSTGANGLAFDKSGDLFAAEGRGKRISHNNQTGTGATVIDKFDGKPLGAPNDLIFDSKGGIYFTDPGSGTFNDPNRHGDVFYLKPDHKEIIRIDDAVKLPNGLTVTTDGKTLIVDDTVGDKLWAYDIQPDGSAKNRRVFATIPQLVELPQAPGQKVSGADGMCLDNAGRVYVTTGTGIQVFGKGGNFLGVIVFPKQPSNCAFAGPGKKMLYATAREAVYRVPVLTAGVKRRGK